MTIYPLLHPYPYCISFYHHRNTQSSSNASHIHLHTNSITFFPFWLLHYPYLLWVYHTLHMTIPSLYNVNNEEDSEENTNSNREEPAYPHTNDNPTDTKAYTNYYKESNRPSKQGFVKANLITIVSALVAITIALTIRIPLELALSIWLSAFIIDAIYTYKNRKYIGYELNYLIRYSKAFYNTLLFGFLLVFVIEIVLLLIISVMLTYMNQTYLVDTVTVFSMFFVVLHISAFIRSYMFIKKIKKIMDSKDSDNDNN